MGQLRASFPLSMQFVEPLIAAPCDS